MLDVDVLESLLINPVNKKNHFIADCPFCGKEKHFYIHKGINFKGYENGFDCKKCGKDGNIITFLLFLDKLYLLEGKEVDINQPVRTSLKGLGLKEISLIKPEDCVIKTIKLPVGYRIAKEGDEFYNYLLGRKFNEIDFLLYQPGFTKIKALFKDYVIIPITKDFKYKAFVSRYIGKDETKKRYINSIHEFNKLLFGFDELNEHTKTVILVEGVFDKISVTTELNLHYNDEMKCLATFGKKLSEIQVYLLQTAGIENLIFMYDGRDAVGDMKRIVGEILNKFRNIWMTYTGYNDPGNSNKKQILEYLSKAEKPNQFWLSKISKLKLR